MNETKEVLFFSMLPISGRALLYWKVTDFALCPSNESSLKMKMIVGTDKVLLTRKTELLDEKCLTTLPLPLQISPGILRDQTHFSEVRGGK